MDTLAGRYGIPPVGLPRDFHPLVVRPAGRTKKKAIRDGQPVKIIGSGGWNRTNGLQVMSLTSYLCSTPQ